MRQKRFHDSSRFHHAEVSVVEQRLRGVVYEVEYAFFGGDFVCCGKSASSRSSMNESNYPNREQIGSKTTAETVSFKTVVSDTTGTILVPLMLSVAEIKVCKQSLLKFKLSSSQLSEIFLLFMGYITAYFGSGLL